MIRPRINGPQIATLALMGLMVAPILAAPVMRAEPAHRVVGIGCGAERHTFTAVEEDHLPDCLVIGTPDEFGCADDDTPAQCADYLGEGW